MMNKMFIALLALVGVVGLTASGNEDLNLIPNGMFQGAGAMADMWRPTKGKAKLIFDDAPDKQPALVLSAPAQVRQFNSIELVAKERYRLSVKYTLTAAADAKAYVVVHNDGWSSNAGFMSITPSENWRELITEFVAFDSTNGRYSIAMGAGGDGVEFKVADLRLEPVSENAKADAGKKLRFEKANYITNGRLDAAQVDFPPFWSVSGKTEYRRNGAPNGGGSILLRGTDENVELRQQHSCQLKAGERYKFSAWIRTRNLNAVNFRIIIHDDNWNVEKGILSVPSDTDWKRFESIFEAPVSKDDDFGFAILLVGGKSGEVEFADLKLEPQSPEAAAGARSRLSSLNADRLIPISPALAKIPADRPELKLRWFGNADHSQFQVQVDGTARPPLTAIDNQVTVPLNGLAAGEHRLKLDNGHESFEYTITIIPPAPRVKMQRLNNLVSRLPELALADGATGEIAVPSDGWYYLTAPAPNAQIKLSGIEQPLTGTGFIMLRAGVYSLSLTGVSGTVDIRRVPAIYYYEPLAGPYLRGMARNDMKQVRKYFLQAVNVYAQSTPDNATADEIAELSRIHSARWGSIDARYDSVEAMVKTINANQFLPRSEFAGLTLDEFSCGEINRLVQFAQAAPQLKIPVGKTLNCWVYGAPPQGAIMADFISGTINASHGDGMVMFEAYCTPSRDEAAARKYCDSTIVGNTLEFQKSYPEILPNLGLIFIHSNVPNSLTAAIYPEIDLKYYLDMQFQTAATAPELDGLGMIGTWGGNYADTEMARWTAALCCHYAVEGQTTLLSERYGYKFAPGFLKNGDFDDGLKYWEAVGAVTTQTHDFYGRNIQWRWTAPKGVGDHFAVLTRGTQPNRLSQCLHGLEAGKLYCLRYLTADAADVTALAGGKPQEIQVDVELEGAEILPEHTVRSRAVPGAKRQYRTNYDSRVFRAAASDPVIHFTDIQTAPGRQSAINYVSVMPFFADDGLPEKTCRSSRSF